MASVAKWLRQRFVVPPFGGSSPLVRPLLILKKAMTELHLVVAFLYIQTLDKNKISYFEKYQRLNSTPDSPTKLELSHAQKLVELPTDSGDDNKGKVGANEE